MVAGHLREQNGYFQMILSWKGKDGKRKRQRESSAKKNSRGRRKKSER